MALTEPISDRISAGPMVAKLTDPLGVSEELLARTQTFRDRVKAGGGSIEDGALESLYDPILRAIKGFTGVGLSDLVFFGAGSAVENNSGSIPALFDASGNENDVTQSDTAKQPTEGTYNGRASALYDITDDVLSASIGDLPDQGTIIVAADSALGKNEGWIDLTDGSGTNTGFLLFGSNGDSLKGRVRSGGSRVTAVGTKSGGKVTVSAIYDASSSRLEVIENGSVVGTASPGTLDNTISELRYGGLFEFSGEYAARGDGLPVAIVMSVALSGSQHSELRNIWLTTIPSNASR
jgi:hypothetical protein